MSEPLQAASCLALRTSFNPGLSNQGAIETEKRISLNEVRAFFIYFTYASSTE